ncbi:hypothetical protein N7539_004577, partial [Penicillium diatomitis]
MRPILNLVLLLSESLALATSVPLSQNWTPTLNITVISAHNGRSTLEFWGLEPGFQISSESGTSGALVLDLGALGGGGGGGSSINMGNMSYSIIPGKFDGGRRNAPARQVLSTPNRWVIFLSGQAHITLSNTTTEAWITGGSYGAILALDTTDVSGLGHYTSYPSTGQTVVLQIPLGERDPVAGHEVLYGGGCPRGEGSFWVGGLDGWIGFRVDSSGFRWMEDWCRGWWVLWNGW